MDEPSGGRPVSRSMSAREENTGERTIDFRTCLDSAAAAGVDYIFYCRGSAGGYRGKIAGDPGDRHRAEDHSRILPDRNQIETG